MASYLLSGVFRRRPDLRERILGRRAKKTNGRGSVRPRYSIARINEIFFRRGPYRSASGARHGLSLGIFESMGAKIRQTMGPSDSFGLKAIAPFRSYNRQILDQIAIAWPPPFFWQPPRATILGFWLSLSSSVLA